MWSLLNFLCSFPQPYPGAFPSYPFESISGHADATHINVLHWWRWEIICAAYMVVCHVGQHWPLGWKPDHLPQITVQRQLGWPFFSANTVPDQIRTDDELKSSLFITDSNPRNIPFSILILECITIGLGLLAVGITTLVWEPFIICALVETEYSSELGLGKEGMCTRFSSSYASIQQRAVIRRQENGTLIFLDTG